jgi:Spherulation-specific family 4
VAETQYLSIGLYSYPPSAFWTAAIGAVPVPAIIIANVDSGPGSGTETNFADIYTEAVDAGILLLGYVPTGYGDTSEADVEAQVADWYSFYPGLIGGIFFDEVLATTGNETYYPALVDYVHTNHAGSTVMLNPGDIPAEAYLSTPIGDIVQVEENTYANLADDAAAAPSWLFDYPSSQIAVTVNTCSNQADMTTAIGLTASAFNAKWVWVTADNIYNAEPSYFGAEVALLTPGPTGDLTVTATQGGGDTNPGILLRVRVLDNAAVAGTPNAGTQSGAEAHSVTITTTEAGSVVYGAIIDGDDAIVPMNAGCTNLDNVTDATNGLCYATFYSGPTGTPGGNSVGTDASFGGGVAALEVLPSGGSIATDASSPAVVSSTAATTITTGSFTPPLGTLLIAFAAAGGKRTRPAISTPGSGTPPRPRCWTSPRPACRAAPKAAPTANRSRPPAGTRRIRGPSRPGRCPPACRWTLPPGRSPARPPQRARQISPSRSRTASATRRRSRCRSTSPDPRPGRRSQAAA